ALQRKPDIRESWHVLDRHKGLAVRVPDGRGQTVRGALFNELRQRLRWREEFESMRLLYVAGTRARERCVFFAAVPQKELKNLSETNRELWLAWIWQALELDEHSRSALIQSGEAQVQLTIDREKKLPDPVFPFTSINASQAPDTIDEAQSLEEFFPL